MKKLSLDERVFRVNEVLVGLELSEVMALGTAMISIAIKEDTDDRNDRQIMLDQVIESLRLLCESEH